MVLQHLPRLDTHVLADEVRTEPFVGRQRQPHIAPLQLAPGLAQRFPDQMVALCEELRQDCDFVLIDSPAGIEQGFRNAIAGADEAIIITTPEVAAVRDADRIIGLLEAHEKSTPKLIINRIKPEMVRRGDMLTTEDVMEILAIGLLGIIPEDEGIIVSINRGIPIALDGQSGAALAFRNIAQRILGQEVPFMAITQEPGLMGRVRRLVGRE